MHKISSCHKNVSHAIKSINIRKKSFYHWFLVNENRKILGNAWYKNQSMLPATAVNDDRILTLCENCNFFAAETMYHKECYVKYMKQAKQNEGSKTKEVVQESQYEIAEKETIKYLMK